MANHEELSTQGSQDEEKTCLSFSEKFTYSLGQTAVSLSPALISSWLVYYYMGRKQADGTDLMLVTAAAMSLAGLIPRLIEALAEPTVGHLSDKWSFRMGRRIPWVLFGTPLLALFSIMIWYPPDADGMGRTLVTILSVPITPNFLWLLFTHTSFWIMYTAVVAPYLSLLPEITPYNNERINVSMFMAYNDVVGSVIGSAGLGVLISVFAGGLTIGGLHLRDAYQVNGYLIGAIFMICFFTSVSKVREKPRQEMKAVEFNFLQSFTETFRNPTFTPYVIASASIRMAIDIILAGMPFMVTRIMALDEGWAGILQGVIIVGAAFFFPVVSSRAIRYGKKRVYLFGMLLFVLALVLLGMMKHAPFFGWIAGFVASLFGGSLSPSWVIFAHATVVLAICALPVAIIFVMQRPILNDVMDYDEKLTGYRREAMYNGMEGLISKPASGIAYAIVPLLLTILGDTPDRPWGVLSTPLVAACIMLIGWFAFRYYQIDK